MPQSVDVGERAIEAYRGVLTMAEFASPDLPIARCEVIPPGIDPCLSFLLAYRPASMARPRRRRKVSRFRKVPSSRPRQKEESMKKMKLRLLLVLVVTSLTLGGRTLFAEEEHTVSRLPPPGGQTLAMSKFYSGPLVKIGTFPGKLVCLRCDLAPSPGSAEQCKEEGHKHALSMEDGSMIHPLLASDEKVLEQINSPELHHEQVKVEGKHYVSTGAILAGRITPAE